MMRSLLSCLGAALPLAFAACQTDLIVYVAPEGGADGGPVPDAASEGRMDGRVDHGDASAVSTLASGQLEPQGLALSATTVYWSNLGKVDDAGTATLGTGSVASIPRAGGAPKTLASLLNLPLLVQYGLGLGAVPTLAWTSGGMDVTSGTVSQLVLVGNTITVVASGQQSPYGVAIDSSNVYWASSNGITILIQYVSLSGSMPTTLGTTTESLTPGCMTLRGTQLFFTGYGTGGGGAVYSLPTSGGTPRVLWTTTSGLPYGIAADADNVYFSVEGPEGGQVYGLSLIDDDAIPPSPVLLASNLTSAYFVAVDEKNLYFATNVQSGGVYEVPKSGGATIELASGLSYPGAVAADDQDDVVYFTTLSAIMTVKKR